MHSYHLKWHHPLMSLCFHPSGKVTTSMCMSAGCAKFLITRNAKLLTFYYAIQQKYSLIIREVSTSLSFCHFERILHTVNAAGNAGML